MILKKGDEIEIIGLKIKNNRKVSDPFENFSPYHK